MLACGVLALALALQLVLPVGEAEPGVPGLAARRTRPVTLPLAPLWPDILAAPIFAPDRKPAPGGSQSAGGGPLAAYAALGAATGGANDTGILSMPGGQTRTLRRGEDVDGWRLVAISRTSLTFEKNGVRHALVVGAPAEASTEESSNPAGTQ
jgi:hypothetical protein